MFLMGLVVTCMEPRPAAGSHARMSLGASNPPRRSSAPTKPVLILSNLLFSRRRIGEMPVRWAVEGARSVEQEAHRSYWALACDHFHLGEKLFYYIIFI
jgi:hypothetical protein